jgi:HEPN domain-containing protein
VVLYDSRRLQLAKTRAGTPRARLELAQKNLRYWFSSATAFWQGSRFYADQLLLSHGAFLLHQAAERYFHALLLVFTGYKPKTHDLEQLLLQVVRLEPALAGAIATAEPRQDELFQLLRRAYIEARYSKSYEISADELAELRTRVHELSRRVLRACTERLATFCGAEAVGPLPEVPVDVDYRQEPPAAAKDDPEAMRRWASLVIHMYETRAQQEALLVGEARGREKGRVEGRREGIEQGLREGEVRGRRRSQARAIVDVLQRRGVELSSGDAQRILSCREESLLARYWDRAFSVDSVRELFDKE